MKQEIEQAIRGILDKSHLTYDKDSDSWSGEVYPDYRDVISDKQIKTIFDADDPMCAFYEMLDEGYREVTWDYESEAVNEVKNHWDASLCEWSEIEDDASDFVQQHVFFDLPGEHFLNQDVQVDIILDTGDGNYDYTLNCVYPHYNGRCGETVDNHAAIWWLTKELGYTKTQMNKALRDNEYGESKYLKSLDQEIANCTTHMNAITFFVNMTLKDCIELNERINAVQKSEPENKYYPWKMKSRECITIPKGTPCGLYDPWNGAGSVLELKIEKDIQVPLKLIDGAMPDGCRGYGVSEIYGMCMSFWRNTPKIA